MAHQLRTALTILRRKQIEADRLALDHRSRVASLPNQPGQLQELFAV